ncbi:MAG: hypothetical protein AAF704_16505 [Cyanobacteria bacterium P01_D01_bin.123]
MSYPDLGCFAECLDCELCDDDWSSIDFPDKYSVPSDFFNDLNGGVGDDFWAPTPEVDEGGVFDDVEIPSVDLPGGGQATPDWHDGPGIQLEWPWG